MCGVRTRERVCVRREWLGVWQSRAHASRVSLCAGGHPVGAGGLKVCMRGVHDGKVGGKFARAFVYLREG